MCQAAMFTPEQAGEEQDHEEEAPERHLADVPKHQDASCAFTNL
jgi:hypothetical protein